MNSTEKLTVLEAKKYIAWYEDTLEKGFEATLSDSAKEKYASAKETIKQAMEHSNSTYLDDKNSRLKSTKIQEWLLDIKYEIAMIEQEIAGISEQIKKVTDKIAELDEKSISSGLTSEELKQYKKLNSEYRKNQKRKTDLMEMVSERKDQLLVLEYSLAHKVQKEQTSGIISELRKSIREYKELKKNASDLLKVMEAKKFSDDLISAKKNEIELYTKKINECQQKLEEINKMSVIEYEKTQKNGYAPELTKEQLIAELKKLNPDAEIEVESLENLKISTTKEPKDLKLPEGFEYNEKNGITNKHKTQSGRYITCTVEKRENKKDWKLEDLVEELKKLNPNANIKLIGFSNPYIRTSVEPEKLKLPAEFSYTKKDGITNKGKTDGQVISCNIVQEKKKEKVEKESRIPLKQRFKITKERKATITSYAAAILKGAGVAALIVAAAPGIAFTGGTLLAGTLVGGGIAAGIEYLLQKFYDGRKKEDDPELKEGNTQGFFKKLINNYKERRKNKEQEKQEIEKKKSLADLRAKYLGDRHNIGEFLNQNALYILDEDREKIARLYKEVEEALATGDINLITEKRNNLNKECLQLSIDVSVRQTEAVRKANDITPQEPNAQDLNSEAFDDYLKDIKKMLSEPEIQTETAGRKV